MSPYQQTQSGQKTTLKNHSQILNMRVPETCASTLPQVMSPSPEEDIYQLYDIQREFGEQDQLAPVLEETRGFGQIQVQSLLDQEVAKMSPIEDMSYLQSGMHFDESVCGKQCRLWSRRWRDAKVADFITVCPRSFWETRCNGHSGKWGKCTNVSFIRRSGSYRETGCIVFTRA